MRVVSNFKSRLHSWWLSQTEWARADTLVALLLLFAGCVYVGFSWSPSSYGHVLQMAGAQDAGVVWGEPRPIRSDEWSVTTPLTQATVNNGLQRYNATSYYNEDLRSNYGMPIRDWGMWFKPAFWGYLFLPPATAFSLSYFLLMAVFLVGYARLFGLLGMRGPHAYLLSISLYFCGVVQFYWNSSASLFAFFPWIVVVLCSDQPAWRRWLFFYWISVCWLISNFYPPIFISMALVGFALLIACRPDFLRPRSVLPILLMAVLACSTAVFYLWDYLTLTIQTLYPGQRTSMAGYYPAFILLTQIWPAQLFDSQFKESVDFTNVTGIGTVGLYSTASALCFLQWSRWRSLLVDHRRAGIALTLAWIATVLWMVAPVPSWIGRLLLWDRVPPERMVYASGLLLVFLVVYLVRVLGIRIDWRKMVLYVALIAFGGLLFEYWTRPVAGAWKHGWDWIVAPLMLAGWLISRRLRMSDTTTVFAIGALCGVLVFGRFNPLQSADPIFNRSPNLLTSTLQANLGQDGVLAVQKDGVIGATFNGLGFKSVSHLAVTPPMTLWEEKFGPLTEAEQFSFNRYAHVRTIAEARPRQLENDQVGIPAKAFRPQPVVQVVQPGSVRYLREDGYLDILEAEKGMLRMAGWAPWLSKGAERQLIIATSVTVSGAPEVFDRERWDLVQLHQDPRRLLSGFSARLEWPAGADSLASVCVFARDGELGRIILLGRAGQPEVCKNQRFVEGQTK